LHDIFQNDPLVAGVSEVSNDQCGKVPFWLWPNVLGLDAPLVAVSWQFFFASVFRMRVPPSNYLALGLVVWVIYSVDRLFDARRLTSPKTAALRHRFYHDRFGPMLIITAVLAAVAGYLCLTALPARLFYFGMFMSIFVIVYFIHRLWVKGLMLVILPKEIFAGFVFAIGATLAGFVWTGEVSLGGRPWVLVSPEVMWFGVLCALNCLAISIWERSSDVGNDANSVAQLWPGSARLFPALASAVALSAASYAFWQRGAAAFPVFLAVALGAAAIALLACAADRLRAEVLRVLADLAVLLPALLLLPISPWASTT
jgi:hypothetical protein